MQYSVKSKDAPGRTASFSYEVGESLEDAITLFGEDVVFSTYQKAAAISAQNVARNQLAAGKTDAEIQGFMDSWTLGIASPRAAVDPFSSIQKKLSDPNLPAEERKELVARIKAMLG